MNYLKESTKPLSLDEIADKWMKIFNELSYAGFQKAKIYQTLNQEFGEDNWIIAHFFDEKIISFLEAAHVYEESYYEFLRDNPDIREWIVSTASEVYDIHPSNIESRLDYAAQECPATHLQDIAVRRALTRLKLEEQGIDYDPNNLPEIPVFEGGHLVQIRGHKTEGYVLNPGKVPFHKPELILNTQQEGWWDEYSVEAFYQKNKVLLVNPKSFIARLAFINPSRVVFEHENKNYYSASYSESGLSDSLRCIKVRGLPAKNSAEIKNSPAKSFSEWREIVHDIKLPYKSPGHIIEFCDL